MSTLPNRLKRTVRGVAPRIRRRRPRLSVIVVVHDMPVQAVNTIASLSPSHQRGVGETDYEIIVVENASQHQLHEQQVLALSPNARYLRRQDSGQSPAAALNTGAAAARAGTLAMMVDGARMVTPGVVWNILAARGLVGSPVVSVPGYHLGQRLHQEAVADGYGVHEEQAALQRLRWREDGYRLFDMAVPSASCSGGYLQPIGESNCIAVPRDLYWAVGGFDERFTTMGGGYVNLDFYRRAVDRGTLVLLPGEGTFHQFHGGATTGAPGVDRDALLAEMRAEYQRLRGEVHGPPLQSPVLLGRVDAAAIRFLDNSVRRWREVNDP